MKNFHNILVIRTDRIGDVVLTTPAIHALRKAYPQARISILVAPLTRDLVLGNPDLNEVLVDDRKGPHKGLGYWRLVRTIREKRFDLAINFHTKKRTNLLCFLAGIPTRIGYKNEKFGFLLTHKIVDPRAQGEQHEAQYCLDVLKALDIYPPSQNHLEGATAMAVGLHEDDLQVFVPLQPQAQAWAETFFRENQLELDPLVIAVHPGSSCPTKKWPAARFAELIHALNDKYACSIIMVGATDNRNTADEILERSDVPVLDLTSRTSVAQLASLFKRCHLVISNDSGPVHIADAVGTPVVSIFTRNQPGINPERWRPLSTRSKVVSVPLDASISFAKGEVFDPKYLEILQVSDVLEAVDGILKLC